MLVSACAVGRVKGWISCGLLAVGFADNELGRHIFVCLTVHRHFRMTGFPRLGAGASTFV